MKFAITGHTKGLGLALTKTPQVENNYIGFSTSTGFDINLPTDRLKIIEMASDCDVFINNAYSGHAQTDLLYDIFKEWRDKKRIIINIGSDTTTGTKNYIWSYSAHKASLEKASEQLSFLKTPCQVMLIKFGWIGSERVLNKFKPLSHIALEDAAAFILDQIKWCQKYNVA